MSSYFQVQKYPWGQKYPNTPILYTTEVKKAKETLRARLSRNIIN